MSLSRNVSGSAAEELRKGFYVYPSWQSGGPRPYLKEVRIVGTAERHAKLHGDYVDVIVVEQLL